MFDMDGTLTEPRKSFDHKTLEPSLLRLSKYAEIGIITGSDEDYLREQMETFLFDSSCRYKTHLMPCNGTKYLKPPEKAAGDFVLTYQVSMEKHLGKKNYRTLMQELIYSQVDMASSGIPLTGHFINCRGSLINWCPVGRNAKHQERLEFSKIDKQTGLRKRVLDELFTMLKVKDLDNKITVKLGGDTSFDIYPRGWDKTYGLRHFQGWDVWFVGDKCEPTGNDFEIYQACSGQSYVSKGPKNTVKIIEQIISKIGGKNE